MSISIVKLLTIPSLHREGEYESLSKDFVILTAAATKINQEGAKDKLVKHFRIALKYDPVNLGGNRIGHIYDKTVEDVISCVEGRTHTHNLVFDNKEDVKKFLQEIKEEQLGLSVIVSGIYDEIKEILNEIGIKPHTVNFSLGIYGNKSKLPSKKIREITTMCGH